MPLSLDQLHQRYLQQATWTAELRRHLFSRTGFDAAKRVLEVGSGTGALLTTPDTNENQIVHGLDIQLKSLQFARHQGAVFTPTAGDAHRLPFPKHSFDLVFCHFLLLWVANPQTIVAEMGRITRPGGAVLALAEPDYGGRIDHPPALVPLGILQAEALRRQGADPEAGRKLSSLFNRAGLLDVETGVLGAQWDQDSEKNAVLEWQVLQSDLEGHLSTSELAAFAAEEELARASGERVLYVPTFYAWGRAP